MALSAPQPAPLQSPTPPPKLRLVPASLSTKPSSKYLSVRVELDTGERLMGTHEVRLQHLDLDLLVVGLGQVVGEGDGDGLVLRVLDDRGGSQCQMLHLGQHAS
jgi:hypothetical protein